MDDKYDDNMKHWSMTVPDYDITYSDYLQPY